MQVPIVENVLKLNDEIAEINRKALKTSGVFTVNLIGSPGCGKTTLLEATFQRLNDQLTIGVIAGDLTTARDAERLAQWSDHVVQISTGKGCHLDANQVRQAMQNLNLDKLDVLVIENVGNLICPVGFDLGQDVKVAMFSATEGDDKAAKHPYLVQEASVILFNKTDLLEYVRFDLDLFRADVVKLNPHTPLIELSAMNHDQAGFEKWIAWLVQNAPHALQYGPA